MKKLKFLWLNLNQFIVYQDEPTVVNAVVAIGSTHREVIVIRPEYREWRAGILKVIEEKLLVIGSYSVLYGDSFTVDTWDQKIKNYQIETGRDAGKFAE